MEIPGVSSGTTQTFKRVDWRVGTVTHIRSEAPGLRSYTFAFDTPVKHDAGQYYELRLTAEDGYQAARLYSAAMPANGTGHVLQLTIALMPYGEVSPYIFRYVKTGSQIEIRGPLGGYFRWTPDEHRPILLVGGGTGVVPLRAIRIEHQQACSEVPLRLLYSVKTYQDMAYKYELLPKDNMPPDDVIMTFTQRSPAAWTGFRRRIDSRMIQDVLALYDEAPIVFVCGQTPMVETVTSKLVEAGLDPETIKAERFGSTA
jgi:ferredoxin-NADP reductase